MAQHTVLGSVHKYNKYKVTCTCMCVQISLQICTHIYESFATPLPLDSIEWLGRIEPLLQISFFVPPTLYSDKHLLVLVQSCTYNTMYVKLNQTRICTCTCNCKEEEDLLRALIMN